MCRQMQWNEKEVKDGPKQMCMDVYCLTMEPSSVSLNRILNRKGIADLSHCASLKR